MRLGAPNRKSAFTIFAPATRSGTIARNNDSQQELTAHQALHKSIQRYNRLHHLHDQPIIEQPYSSSAEYSLNMSESINLFCDIFEKTDSTDIIKIQQLFILNNSKNASLYTAINFILWQCKQASSEIQSKTPADCKKFRSTFVNHILSLLDRISYSENEPINHFLTAFVYLHIRFMDKHISNAPDTKKFITRTMLIKLQQAVIQKGAYSDAIQGVLGHEGLNYICHKIDKNKNASQLREELAKHVPLSTKEINETSRLALLATQNSRPQPNIFKRATTPHSQERGSSQRSNFYPAS